MTSRGARISALRRWAGLSVDAEDGRPADGNDIAVGLLQELVRRQGTLEEHLAALRSDIESLRNDVWASKVVPVGERLMVGSRHENLVFLLEADDQLIVPRFVVEGEYEPATTAFMKEVIEEDSICIDVGANFGYYTCLMAHLAWAGKVLAYEADPRNYALLVDNVDINWSDGIVEPINAAVGARAGELTLYRWLRRSANTGVIKPPDRFADESEPFTVPAITLDDLVGQLEQVHVVKIDVEGAESLVVAGMSNFVRAFKPIIILEWSPTQMEAAGFEAKALAAAIAEWSMDLWTLGPQGRRRPLGAADLESLTFQNVVISPPGRFDRAP